MMTDEPRSDQQQSWQRRVVYAVLPHLFTALVTLVIAWALWGQQRNVVVSLAQPTPVVVPRPTAMPAPATPTPASEVVRDISRQELLDVKAETQALWSAVYLSRALMHASDAELTLRENDLGRVEQILLLLDDVLQRATSNASTTARDPIEQLRRDVVTIRQDLYVRPDGMDQRLARMRQALLTLVGERDRP
jgi:hypothetical protein